MLDKELDISVQDLLILVGELYIKYRNLLDSYYLIKEQLGVIKSKDDEINKLKNELDNLVLRYNRLESEKIQVESELSRYKEMVELLRKELTEVYQKAEEKKKKAK